MTRCERQTVQMYVWRLSRPVGTFRLWRRQALTNRWQSRKTAAGLLARWPLWVICLRSRIPLCRGFRDSVPNAAFWKRTFFCLIL